MVDSAGLAAAAGEEVEMTNEKRKNNSTKANLLLDVAIFVAFLLALDPRLTGITIHEWLSLAAAAAVAVHLLWHWEWIVGVTRRFLGRTSGAARLNYIVDTLFFVDVAVILFSGLMISQAILPALGLAAPGGSFWLILHSLSADWAIILMAVHTALHWKWIANAVKRYVLRPIGGLTRPEVIQ
jgi:hypothetical protein